MVARGCLAVRPTSIIGGTVSVTWKLASEDLQKSTQGLNLLAGELIEVRSREEILSTLDPTGKLDAMPFMPEMLQYCGKRFRVFKRADKTCDNIKQWSLRRVKNAVHLTGLRCDGTSHGNCDAGCLLFWNEAWLKKVDLDFVSASLVTQPGLA